MWLRHKKNEKIRANTYFTERDKDNKTMQCKVSKIKDHIAFKKEIDIWIKVTTISKNELS